MMTRSLSRIGCVAALLLGVGCEGKSVGLGGNETQEATQLPAVKVDLPPQPSFADEDKPLAFPDGSLTVFGVRKQKDKFLGKEVKVKAYLLDVYKCPPCPKHQTCKACEQPHFYLSDKAGGPVDKAIMVVDYLMPKQKPPALTVGKQYDVTGQFAVNSPAGFADSDGLLVFSSMIDDHGKTFLSQAEQLQQKALAGEAAEAAKLKHAPR